MVDNRQQIDARRRRNRIPGTHCGRAVLGILYCVFLGGGMGVVKVVVPFGGTLSLSCKCLASSSPCIAVEGGSFPIPHVYPAPLGGICLALGTPQQLLTAFSIKRLVCKTLPKIKSGMCPSQPLLIQQVSSTNQPTNQRINQLMIGNTHNGAGRCTSTTVLYSYEYARCFFWARPPLRYVCHFFFVVSLSCAPRPCRVTVLAGRDNAWRRGSFHGAVGVQDDDGLFPPTVRVSRV